MRIKHIRMGSINELPPELKKKMIDKYRDMNVQDDWYDSTIEGFIEDMNDRGIDVYPKTIGWDDLYDRYATYDGIVNVGYFCASSNKITKLLLKKYNGFNIKFSGKNFDIETQDYDEDEFNDDNMDLEDVMLAEGMSKEEIITAIEELFEDIQYVLREYGKDLMKRLRDDEDYLTTDEAIIETMEANDMEFEIEEIKGGKNSKLG